MSTRSVHRHEPDTSQVQHTIGGISDACAAAAGLSSSPSCCGHSRVTSWMTSSTPGEDGRLSDGKADLWLVLLARIVIFWRRCPYMPTQGLTNGQLAGWLRFVTLMLTNVYVGGFNLYYGCLKGTPYEWLDLGALCQALLPPNKIQRIRYFTAKVSAQADPHQPVRQSTYLRALQTVPELTVHLGHFLTSTVRMPLAIRFLEDREPLR